MPKPPPPAPSHSARVAQLRAHPASSGDADADASYTTSSMATSSGSAHRRRSFDAAPTPFNTYCDTETVDSKSNCSVEVTAPTDTSYTYDEELAYEPYAHPDVSIADSLGDTSVRRPSHTLSFNDVPTSTRPVPAPPQQISSFSSSGTGDGSRYTLHQVCSSDMGRSVSGDERQHKRLNFLRRPLSRTVIDRDTLRLQQLGYDAVLGRDYTFWSSFCISWINIGTVQGTIFSVPASYKFGGPTMTLVAWPISGLLSLALVSTLSELASAYPVAGAMASWSWKMARGGVGGERYWGWVMGGIVLGGHIGNLVLVARQNVTMIVGIMGLTTGYDPVRWHMVLFYLAIVFVVGTIAATRRGSGARYWIGAGIFTLCAWVILVISLLATGVSHRDFKNEKAISTSFFNSSGWSSRGYVYMLGWQYSTIASGADASAHMSEETQNPARNVPKAMTWAIIGTYTLAYISIILLFISVDPQTAAFLATQDFPVGHILEEAVNAQFAVAMCIIAVVCFCLQLQAQLQASSRFVFALARDRALPFSDTIKSTNRSKQPWVAHLICVVLWAACAPTLLAETGVVLSVVTVVAGTLSMLGYFIPVFLYLLSKKDLQLEGRMTWSLRKWSRPVAVVGAGYCLAVVLAQCLPGHRPVTVSNMSWSPIVIAGTLIISFCTWKLYGDKHYSGPIRALTKWETGMEIDLDSTLQASTQRQHDGTATSLKRAVTPYIPTTVHTVEVAPACTVDSVTSGGEWASAPWSASVSDESGSGSARSNRGSGMYPVKEEDEEGEVDRR